VISRRFVETAIVWCREIAIPALAVAVLVTASAPANDVYSYAVADVAPVATDITPRPANVPLSGQSSASGEVTTATINLAAAPEAAAPNTDAPKVEPKIEAKIEATVESRNEPRVDPSSADQPVPNGPVSNGPVLAALEASDEKPPQPSLDTTTQPNNVAGPQKEEIYDASAIEIDDECLVMEICVDRFLWQLYQRTPKEDSIRETRQKRVTKQITVKKKRKTITVTKTWSVSIDEDFGWKDPKAAKVANMSLADYVIGGVDRNFKLRLFSMLHAADQAGLAPGITSGFRDDYRQSIASGLKAASNRSYHGGSLRGGYGHGLAADIVSVKGATRAERLASSNALWKWVDDHGSEFGLGRPYLDRDPPHVAPNDGEEFAHHRPGAKTRQAAN